MADQESFNTGVILERLKHLEEGRNEQFSSLHECIDRLETTVDEWKKGQGERLEKNGERITVLETKVDPLIKAAWVLFVSCMGVVIAAFWKLVLK